MPLFLYLVWLAWAIGIIFWGICLLNSKTILNFASDSVSSPQGGRVATFMESFRSPGL